MNSVLIGLDYPNYNGEQNKKKSSISKIIHKNTISYNKYKISRINTSSDNGSLRTGDRFIPFKNDKDNFQNFLLKNNSNVSNIEKNKLNNSALLSPLKEKPEKNYASFIVDNMLRTNADQYNLPQSKMGKFTQGMPGLL